MATTSASNQSNNNSAAATEDGDDDDKNNNNNNAPLSYFQKTVTLQDWWLIKTEKDFEGKRLAIAGLTSREKQAVRVFSSAPILKRNDMLTLETIDGICVVIEGCINKVRTKENGFPSEVFDHFVFGFPHYWEEYAEKCLGEGFGNKDVSSTLGRDKLSIDSGSVINHAKLFGVDDCSEGIPDRNKADVCEERHGNSSKMDSSSEDRRNMFSTEGQHEGQDGACNESSVEDPQMRSLQVVPEMVSCGASSPEVVITCPDENISLGSGSASSFGPRETQKESLPAESVVEGNKIPEISEKIIEDTMKSPIREMNANATTSNTKRRISSRLKNLINHKTRNGCPGLEANEDLDEEKLNAISAAETDRSVGKRDALKEISLSEGRMCNHLFSKSKSMLKDDRKTVNPLEYEENRLSSSSRRKLDHLKKAAVNGESKSGGRSDFIPSGVGLQPTDEEQRSENSASQAGKQSKNMNKVGRSSIGLGDAKQIDDLEIDVGKKGTNVKNASKYRTETKRKLTYGSPVTHGGTEKTSFVSPESLSLGRSRSGRLLLPTLEFWRNQTAIYDADRQITGIQGGPSRESRSEPQRKQRKLP